MTIVIVPIWDIPFFRVKELTNGTYTESHFLVRWGKTAIVVET